MIVKSILKHVHLSPRKARLVVDLVRGKSVGEAVNLLEFLPKKGAVLVKKVIFSALASAQERGVSNLDKLYVSKAQVNMGKTLKRFMPRAQGRATPIKKRYSHIEVELAERFN
jgi:large subunit ribosomal protein L22